MSDPGTSTMLVLDPESTEFVYANENERPLQCSELAMTGDNREFILKACFGVTADPAKSFKVLGVKYE